MEEPNVDLRHLGKSLFYEVGNEMKAPWFCRKRKLCLMPNNLFVHNQISVVVRECHFNRRIVILLENLVYFLGKKL